MVSRFSMLHSFEDDPRRLFSRHVRVARQDVADRFVPLEKVEPKIGGFDVGWVVVDVQPPLPQTLVECIPECREVRPPRVESPRRLEGNPSPLSVACDPPKLVDV